MRLRLLGLLLCIVFSSALHAQIQPVSTTAEFLIPPIETIVSRMVAQGHWNEEVIQSFEMLRSFRASNPRFKQKASRQVRTIFRAPDFQDSTIVKEEGSAIILQRVFDPILDAEKEVHRTKQKSSYDIVPENYLFTPQGVESCGERKCFRLAIAPKRKNKYLLDGVIWVDAEDFGLAKVQGSPSKRLSLWTLKTEITRIYTRVGNVWLTSRIDSDSDIVIAGRSNLSIEYTYSSLRTDDHCAAPGCAVTAK